jgi:hypothetical protein
VSSLPPGLRGWSRERGLAAAAVVAAVLAGVLAVEAVRARREAGRLRAELEAARGAAATDSLQAVGGRPGTAGGLPPGADGPAQPPGLLAQEVHLARLRRAGLDDPLADLRADLQARPELIPLPGRLGGRMGFYSPDDIVLLNDRWVYAYFEDGHTAGSMLLEFDVREGGGIAWRPLAAAAW